ncbi:amphi-Trp domain-containing protein [Halosimplex sp. J119]
MPEEVIFADERNLTRTDVASYLRTVADRLDAGETVTFEAGADSVTLEVPNDVEFEVKVEREGPADGPGELGFELELEWNEDATEGGDSLSIS